MYVDCVIGYQFVEGGFVVVLICFLDFVGFVMWQVQQVCDIFCYLLVDL